MVGNWERSLSFCLFDWLRRMQGHVSFLPTLFSYSMWSSLGRHDISHQTQLRPHSDPYPSHISFFLIYLQLLSHNSYNSYILAAFSRPPLLTSNCQYSFCTLMYHLSFLLLVVVLFSYLFDRVVILPIHTDSSFPLFLIYCSFLKKK